MRRYNDLDDFENKLNDLNTSKEYINFTNLSIEDGQSISISFIDRLVGFRFPDGYEDIPKTNWIIEVTDSKDNKYGCSFDFVDYRNNNEREKLDY